MLYLYFSPFLILIPFKSSKRFKHKFWNIDKQSSFSVSNTDTLIYGYLRKLVVQPLFFHILLIFWFSNSWIFLIHFLDPKFEIFDCKSDWFVYNSYLTDNKCRSINQSFSLYIYTLADASPIRSMTSISCLRSCLASYLKNINVKLYDRKIWKMNLRMIRLAWLARSVVNHLWTVGI